MNGFLRWLWPLIASALTVVAVWRVFLHVEFGEDAATPLFIGAVFLFAALVLVIFTRRWELRGLGQVLTYVADAGLYGGLGLSRTGRWGGFTEAYTEMLRALFVVGGVFLVAGVAKYLATDYRNGRKRIDDV